MARRFLVVFKNNVNMLVNDIIDFEQKQIDEILAIAAEYEKDALKAKKYGIPLSYITDNQKEKVLLEKQNIIGDKDSLELKKKNTIQFGGHSLIQILKRIGSTGENVLVDLIDRLKATDTVTQAQFKGFPTMSYSLMENGDTDEYTFAISFLITKRRNRFLKMITVHLNSHEPEEFQFRVSELNPDYYRKLADMKELIERDKK